MVNAKGGVGKTSVTVNLADALTRLKKKVLIIDNDAQGNTTKRLLKTPDAVDEGYTLKEWFGLKQDDLHEPQKFIYPTLITNLYVVPNGRTTGVERELIIDREFDGIRKFRDYIKENFDFCLIDCPPNMGVFVMNALFGSDFAVVPVLATSTDSIEGLNEAIEIIEFIAEKDNPDLRFLRLLINQADKRKAISRYNIERINQNWGSKKSFKTHIPSNTQFEMSEAGGETIFKTAPSSSGCNAYRKLAKEVCDILKRQQ